MENLISIKAINDFTHVLLEGDFNSARQQIDFIIKSRVRTEDIYDQFIKQSLYEIGQLWKKRKISVAKEYLSTAVVEILLSEFYLNFSYPNNLLKSVVVACVENEYHQIGLSSEQSKELSQYKSLYYFENSYSLSEYHSN